MASKTPFSDVTIADLIQTYHAITSTAPPGNYDKPLLDLQAVITSYLTLGGLNDYRLYLLTPSTCITQQLSLLPLRQLESFTLCLGHLLQLRQIPNCFWHFPLDGKSQKLITEALAERKVRLAAAAAAAVAAAAAGKEKSREIAEPHVFPRPALDLKTADYIMFRDMLKFVAQFFHLASRANDYGYYGFCISYPEFGQQLAMWGVLLNAVFKREARKYGLRFEEFKGEEWYHNDQLGFLIEAGRAFRVRGVPQCDCGAERVLVLGASAMRKVEEVVDWGVYGMNESEGEEIREGTGLKIRFVNWTVPEGEEYYGDDSEDSESGTSGSESLSEMEEEEEGEEEKEGRDAIMEGNGDDIMEDVEY